MLEELWGIGLARRVRGAAGRARRPSRRGGRRLGARLRRRLRRATTTSAWTTGAQELLHKLLVEHAEAEELVALSQATEADLDLPADLGGELMPFQAAGVRYALRRRRAFIADEQGLGKTVQALCRDGVRGGLPGDRRSARRRSS